MDAQQSRNELQAELRRRGLPRAYVERLLAELDDHFTDLVEERSAVMSMARMPSFETPNFELGDLRRRLGKPAELADFAKKQYRARSFFGRHPLLTFLIGPLPLLVVMLIGYMLAIFAISYAIAGVIYVSDSVFGSSIASIAAEDHPWLASMLLVLSSWVVIVMPPLTATWMLCRVAGRNALDWRWPVLGCALVAVVAAVFMVKWQLSTGPGTGRFMIGFDFGTSPSWLFLRFLPKFALAWGIGLLLWRRAQTQFAADGEIPPTMEPLLGDNGR